VSYPILVERLAGETVLDMGCNACGHWWRTNDPEEFMLSTMLEVSGACSRRCMLVAEYAAQLQKGPE
jgi:hypothetical protein